MIVFNRHSADALRRQRLAARIRLAHPLPEREQYDEFNGRAEMNRQQSAAPRRMLQSLAERTNRWSRRCSSQSNSSRTMLDSNGGQRASLWQDLPKARLTMG